MCGYLALCTTTVGFSFTPVTHLAMELCLHALCDRTNFMSTCHEECFGTLTTLDTYLYFTDKPEFFPYKMLVHVLSLWNPCHRVLYSCDVVSVPLSSWQKAKCYANLAGQ